MCDADIDIDGDIDGSDLAKAFGGSAESWLIQQAQFDLWQAMKKADEIKVKALF